MQLKRLSSGAIMAQSVEQAEVVCTTCSGAGLGPRGTGGMWEGKEGGGWVERAKARTGAAEG